MMKSRLRISNPEGMLSVLHRIENSITRAVTIVIHKFRYLIVTLGSSEFRTKAAYTKDPIPPFHQSQYSLRCQDVIGRLRARTEKFKSSFYPNCLSEWNKLQPELRLAPSVAIFKKKILSIIRPPAKSVFGIHDPKGLSYLTQLRVGLSKLNFHKFKHNFRDTINPMCPTSDGIEDTEHFLLLCPSFDLQRRDLLTGIVELLRPFVEITNLSNDALMQLLLYGDQYLSYDLNRNILELTLRFIHETGRFD